MRGGTGSGAAIHHGIHGIGSLALPTPTPTAGSAAAGAGPPANRPASGTSAGRAASTIRFATPGRSDPGTRCTGSTKPAGVSRPRSNTLRSRSRSPASLRLIVHRIDIHRQLALSLQIVNRIFEGGVDVFGIQAQPPRQRLGEMPRFERSKVGAELLSEPAARDRATAERRRCASNKSAPSAAEARPDTICPARSAAARPERSASARRSSSRSASLRFSGPSAADVPLRAVHVVDGDERGLAAHGEANVAGANVLIDAAAERLDALPLRVGVGQRDARVFVDARHRHLVRELHFALIHGAGDRRGRGRLREWRPAECGLPRRAIRRSGPAPPTPRPADTLRSRRADR